MSDTAFARKDGAPSGGIFSRLRDRSAVSIWSSDGALRIVYAGTLAYAAVFLFAAALHYAVFKSPRGDLGHMVQAIWNTLHGHFLETTTVHGYQRDRLGYHVDPLLLAFAPLFWIFSSPLVLPVVQVLAVTSGALPVFWLARKHLGSSRAGVCFAFAYLLYPATQFNAFTVGDSFHPVSIAVPLVLYAVWFLDEDRLVAFSVLALLAACAKEEIALAVGCLGIWYAVRKGRRGFGISVFVAGLAITLVNFLWVIPHFSATHSDSFDSRYRAVGGTPQGMVHKAFTDPMAFVHTAASGHKALYLGLLFVPFLCLSLFEPLLLLGAVPDLMINLLSSNSGQTSIGVETTAGIVPFVVVAAIFGARRLGARAGDLAMGVLAATALFAVISPIYALGSDVRALGSPVTSAKADALRLVPGGVPVSASNQLGGHLSERQYISTFPFGVRSRWIIVDINDPSYHDIPAFKRDVRKYERDRRAWQVVFSSHGVAVLHKRAIRGGGRGT